MRLRVFDHLRAVLDGPEQAICVVQRIGVGFGDVRCGAKCFDRVEGRGLANGRIPAAVNHLLDLGEELDFANPAAATLQVVAGTEPRPLREMIADAGGNLADLFDHSEVERAAPHERLNRLQEMLTERLVAGAHARANEGCSFPG